VSDDERDSYGWLMQRTAVMHARVEWLEVAHRIDELETPARRERDAIEDLLRRLLTQLLLY
jgi:hypothetical protein